MEVHFEDEPSFLVARAAGSFSLEGMIATFEKTAAVARARGARRVLFDAAAITGDLPDLDRYDLGKRAAEVFAHIERLAVVRPANVRYTGFAFDVAQNRGLDARAFLDPKAAADWLQNP